MLPLLAPGLGVCTQQVKAEDMKHGCLLLEGYSEGCSWVTVTFPSCLSAPSAAVMFVIPSEPLPCSQGGLKLVKSFCGSREWTVWFVKHAW